MTADAGRGSALTSGGGDPPSQFWCTGDSRDVTFRRNRRFPHPPSETTTQETTLGESPLRRSRLPSPPLGGRQATPIFRAALVQTGPSRLPACDRRPLPARPSVRSVACDRTVSSNPRRGPTPNPCNRTGFDDAARERETRHAFRRRSEHRGDPEIPGHPRGREKSIPSTSGSPSGTSRAVARSASQISRTAWRLRAVNRGRRFRPRTVNVPSG